MIISNKPENEAIVSNVSSVGEFRIRNSAKAFSILSSGLYANKIRAIIRELSCNAVDSHVAAGREHIPFDVHLPNRIEPWFSIRDYGVGLSHDQVVNIYTTYFESTKTESNAFIGALGLGSKSPFSYTENFTVTAIQGGVKGVYSAFINNEGVPSIAKMASVETDEENGVEVKFSVSNADDFHNFKTEAQEVYKWFSVKPRISGVYEIAISDWKTLCSELDVLPGIHIMGNYVKTVYDSYRHKQNCIALMGNIPYPIDVPNARANLAHLESILYCDLVIQFDIGDIEFQASREGLSYTQTTISSIRKKLTELNAILAKKITKELEEIPNLWESASYLAKKCNERLYQSTVFEIIKNLNHPLIHITSYGLAPSFKNLTLDVDALERKFNIKLNAFVPNYRGTSYTQKTSYNYDTKSDCWEFRTGLNLKFVIQDTKVGCIDRAKAHFRNDTKSHVVVITPFDKTKPILVEEFMDSIHNPPSSMVLKASQLKPVERKKSVDSDVSLMQFVRTGNSYRQDGSWREAGKIDSYDDNTTYYYLPLNGFSLISNYGTKDPKGLVLEWLGYNNKNQTVFGVRKKDIEKIKKLKNWVNLEDHIISDLNSILEDNLRSWILLEDAQLCSFVNILTLIKSDLDANCEFYSLLKPYIGGMPGSHRMLNNYKSLVSRYSKYVVTQFDNLVETSKQEAQYLMNRYPMLKLVCAGDLYNLDKAKTVVDYINLIEKK